MTKDNYERLLKYVAIHEGFSGKYYKCPAGKKTIGFGRNVDDNPLLSDEIAYLVADSRDFDERPMTWDEGLWLLDKSVKQFMFKLLRDYKNFTQYDDVRQIALIDIEYNTGNVFQFITMGASLEKGDFEAAGDALAKTKYFKQVGRRAIRNVALIKSGVFLDIEINDEYAKIKQDAANGIYNI